MSSCFPTIHRSSQCILVFFLKKKHYISNEKRCIRCIYKAYSTAILQNTLWNYVLRDHINAHLRRRCTAWKVSKYGVIFGLYFPVFGLNTEIYFVDLLLHIQSEYRKIQTRNNSVFGHFSRSDEGKINMLPNALFEGIIKNYFKTCIKVLLCDTKQMPIPDLNEFTINMFSMRFIKDIFKTHFKLRIKVLHRETK